MAKKVNAIPVNAMANEFGEGIAIEKMSFRSLSHTEMEEGEETHRHDGHSFFLLEEGTVSLEVDFKSYNIKPMSVIYIHPDQVHRTIASNNVTVSAWSIVDENLNPGYLQLLQEIVPAEPLMLNQDTASILVEAVSLTLKLAKRKGDKLYHALLKDSCNTLVAMVISQYLEHAKTARTPLRFEVVNKAFRAIMEQNFRSVKQPSLFAEKLNISTAYLNECVKNTTGFSVSYHIQQRVILEAKRLLFHSNKSMKEIASELGYVDYPYFSRLFTKVVGITPIAFRKRNHA
jgi:AraC family transcriptional activator of pobA